MTKPRICKDCKREGRTGKPLNLVDGVPGPRCFRHAQKWKRDQRQRTADARRQRIYGVSPEQYRAIINYQGGACVCGRQAGKRRLAMDHDHSCCPGRESCGKCVRFAACWTCNKYLEHIRDDPAVLERLAEWLRNPPARIVLSNNIHVS